MQGLSIDFHILLVVFISHEFILAILDDNDCLVNFRNDYRELVQE